MRRTELCRNWEYWFECVVRERTGNRLVGGGVARGVGLSERRRKDGNLSGIWGGRRTTRPTASATLPWRPWDHLSIITKRMLLFVCHQSKAAYATNAIHSTAIYSPYRDDARKLVAADHWSHSCTSKCTIHTLVIEHSLSVDIPKSGAIAPIYDYV